MMAEKLMAIILKEYPKPTQQRQNQLIMKNIILCASIFGVVTAVNAQNANITCGAPTTISGASDVSVVGTIVGTWASGDDWGGGNRADYFPVNGVTFAAYGSGVFGSFINQTGFDARYEYYNSPGTADSNYNYLLQTGEYNNFNDNNSGSSVLSMTWGGMTPGDTYQLEFWVNDARDGGSVDRTETLTGGTSTSGALSYGFAGGGVGQFILGTFVADGTGTETLTVDGAGGGGSA
jgi:hypothetical protein